MRLLLEALGGDLRYAVRGLAGSPVFSAITLVSLAVGIGLNSAIFGAASTILVQPLPYKDPDRITRIAQGARTNPSDPAPSSITPANFLDWEERNHVFERMAVYERVSTGYALTAGGQAEGIRAMRVSAAFFPVLGVPPKLGRTFLAEEDQPGARVVVLSHDLWQRRFGGTPDILDSTVIINNDGYRVVGVMPPSFRFYQQFPWSTRPGGSAELWLPHPYESNPATNRQYYTLAAIGRLRNGVSLDMARREMQGIADQLMKEYPRENGDLKAWVSPLREDLASEVRPAVRLIFAASALVLLVSCANVAGLQLARGEERRRYTAIRSAIGAPRIRLLRQHFLESLLLALVGGAAGMLLAVWSSWLFAGVIPERTLRLSEASLDMRVAGFTMTLSMITALASGLAPAILHARTPPGEVLRGAHHASPDRHRLRYRRALIAAQVTVSFILLVGAGLMANSVWRLYRLPLGFEPAHVLAVSGRLPNAAPYAIDLGFRQPIPGRALLVRMWAPGASARDFTPRVLDRLEKLPDVESVAIAATVGAGPLRASAASFEIEGRTPAGDSAKLSATQWTVSPGYFRTLRIPLWKGRVFTEGDRQEAPGVAIVNRSMERAFWNTGPGALGQRLAVPAFEKVFEIVGVVDDVRAGVTPDTPWQLYLPVAQTWDTEYADFAMASRLTYVALVRTRSSPLALAERVRATIGDVEPGQPSGVTRTYDDLIADVFSPWRSLLVLLGLFAAVAVLLSLFGIYGVISQAMTQRTREIGIRMALGAARARVLWLMMKVGLVPVVLGLLIGAAILSRAGHLIEERLFGVPSTDVFTLVTAAVLLVVLAMAACYFPARRVSRLDVLPTLTRE